MRRKDDKHLAFLRTLNCIICGDNTSTEACHIKMADARVAKRIASSSLREDDRFCLPMCGAHHREQHSMGERKFWQGYGIDAVLMALAIYSVSGDAEEAERIMSARHVNILAAG